MTIEPRVKVDGCAQSVIAVDEGEKAELASTSSSSTSCLAEPGPVRRGPAVQPALGLPAQIVRTLMFRAATASRQRAAARDGAQRLDLHLRRQSLRRFGFSLLTITSSTSAVTWPSTRIE